MDNEEGWKNFEEFIQVANQHCNWLVLRNFEYLPNNFFENDKDVDILCDDLEYFISIMKLKKRSWGIAAYETIIENQIVAFDVRFIGDGYYDKLWEYKMLQNKIYTSNSVPRMSPEDYFFSLLYHVKIQKNNIKNIYKIRLYQLAIDLEIENYQLELIDNNQESALLLSSFMKKNHYVYTKPFDSNVFKNRQFVKLLDKNIQKGVILKIPYKIKFLGYIPNSIFKFSPYYFKVLIKKVLF